MLTKVVDDQRKIVHSLLVMKTTKSLTTSILTSILDDNVEVSEKNIIIVTNDDYPNHYVSVSLDTSGVLIELNDEADRSSVVVYHTTNQDVKDILSEDYYVYVDDGGIVIVSDDLPEYKVLFGIDDGGHISIDILTEDGVETNVCRI